MAHSITLWKLASRPNYSTNINLVYPYSETPFLGQYNLVKIPLSLNELVPHVDYWGEGRILSQHGTSGFTNSYNVNHPFQLVSNGSDRDKKIPNRIPVLSYNDCDTSAYIKDNSVALVTVMGAPINKSCAADIARIINNDLGQVLLYGFDANSNDVANLTAELESKSLFYCPMYKLPAELETVSLFRTHMAFVNVTVAKEELYKSVVGGAYDEAVTLAKKLANESNGNVISELVMKILNGNNVARAKLMSFAYKLWNTGGIEVIKKYFPSPLSLIFGKNDVKIVNKGYDQALKLDADKDRYNDRLAWGDKSDKTSRRVKWQFIPVWVHNEVTFKIYNVDCDMYLKLDVTADGMGDRKAWGSSNSGEDRHRFYIEPYMNGSLVEFHIINYQYRQGLKLAVAVDYLGDRPLYGHNGDIYANEGRFKWIISAV